VEQSDRSIKMDADGPCGLRAHQDGTPTSGTQSWRSRFSRRSRLTRTHAF
jgi:hypothetical protein